MSDIFPITSAQNDRFKSLLSLREKKARVATGTFLVEGQKEIELAIKNGFTIEALWVVENKKECHFVPKSFEDPRSREISISEKFGNTDPSTPVGMTTDIFSDSVDFPVYTIPETLFTKVGYREKTEGVIAVVRFRPQSLADIILKDSALVIVADQLEKPGNMGALFRIADGVGASAVILAGLSSDVYNPNVIRNSVGTFFAVPFAIAEPKDVVAWLAQQSMTGVVASPEAKTTCPDVVWPKRTALIVGREHEGVQSNWGKTALQVGIPMHGQNDSLNVAVSTGILAYEWARTHRK